MRSILLTNSINIPKLKIHRSKKYLGLLEKSKQTSIIFQKYISLQKKKNGELKKLRKWE